MSYQRESIFIMFLPLSVPVCPLDGRIVEMCELTEHPFFVATQGHPELKSRPNRPHPLFKGFVEAALENKHRK